MKKNAAPAAPALKQDPLFIFLILIIGISVYITALMNQFVWDDIGLITENSYLRDWRSWGKFFTENIFSGSGRISSFYRPLQMVSYLIDSILWKLHPAGFHLTNILLHSGAALSLYGFVRKLFKDAALAFLTGLFFVIHPVHVEAVAYIAGRSDLMALLFIMLGLTSYLKYLDLKSPFAYLATLLCFVAALLSRESSLVFPGLVFLCHGVIQKKKPKGIWISFLIVALLYLLLRITILKDLQGDINAQTTLFQRLPGFFVALASYIRLLLFPHGLHMEYGLIIFPYIHLTVLLGAGMFLLFMGIMKHQHQRNKIVAFSIGWFFLGLLPVSNLFPLNAYMAEHWLYLPSVGFFLLLAYFIKYVFFVKNHWKKAGVFLTVGIILLWALLTIKQISCWKNPKTLFETTCKYAPKSFRSLNNLGVAYQNNKNLEEAETMFKKAIALNPQYADGYTNLGVIYETKGKLNDAILAYQKAIELDPNKPAQHYNLGNAYQKSKMYQEAIEHYLRASELNPNDSRAFWALGKAYEQRDALEKAAAHYTKALLSSSGNAEINDRLADALLNLGVLYQDRGEFDKAIVIYENIIRQQPAHKEAYNNLGLTLASMGQTDKAIATLEKVVAIAPDYGIGFKNLAVVCYQAGKIASAKEYCERALLLGAKIPESFMEALDASKNNTPK